MQDSPNTYDTPLGGLDWSAWLDAAEGIVDEDGYVERLGRRHAAIFLEEKPTLLVTFETRQVIIEQSQNAHPLGWTMVKALGWSHLCVVCNGDSWFQDVPLVAITAENVSPLTGGKSIKFSQIRQKILLN